MQKHTTPAPNRHSRKRSAPPAVPTAQDWDATLRTEPYRLSNLAVVAREAVDLYDAYLILKIDHKNEPAARDAVAIVLEEKMEKLRSLADAEHVAARSRGKRS